MPVLSTGIKPPDSTYINRIGQNSLINMGSACACLQRSEPKPAEEDATLEDHSNLQKQLALNNQPSLQSYFNDDIQPELVPELPSDDEIPESTDHLLSQEISNQESDD